ncbi:MAG: thioredoxin fold domain-containing protein [Bacteroidetes bacterium]|nr:thioredoxin fold domain-containing protein [Bacteroidota bacterium]
MRKIVNTLVLVGFMLFSANQQEVKAQMTKEVQLSAPKFSAALNKGKALQILDVRTPKEFEEGHLKGALNMDWTQPAFKKEIAQLDKKKPVYVYCLSGGRSAKAADFLQENGFTVYELQGGIMKWRAAQLPEVKGGKTQQDEMDTAIYETMIGEHPVLLVDFYADWCEPCKRMKPYLEEIDQTMKDKVKVLRINVDKNKKLVKNLGVDALPVLMLYKNQNLVWKEQGFVPKEKVLEKLSEK